MSDEDSATAGWTKELYHVQVEIHKVLERGVTAIEEQTKQLKAANLIAMSQSGVYDDNDNESMVERAQTLIGEGNR